MNQPGPSLRPNLRGLIGVALSALVLVTITFIGVAGGDAGACAAPPPGWHQVLVVGPILWLFGPPAVAFFVLAYFALGIRSRRRRSLALVGTFALMPLVAFTTLMFMPFSCGSYAP